MSLKARKMCSTLEFDCMTFIQCAQILPHFIPYFTHVIYMSFISYDSIPIRRAIAIAKAEIADAEARAVAALMPPSVGQPPSAAAAPATAPTSSASKSNGSSSSSSANNNGTAAAMAPTVERHSVELATPVLDNAMPFDEQHPPLMPVSLVNPIRGCFFLGTETNARNHAK